MNTVISPTFPGCHPLCVEIMYEKKEKGKKWAQKLICIGIDKIKERKKLSSFNGAAI